MRPLIWVPLLVLVSCVSRSHSGFPLESPSGEYRAWLSVNEGPEGWNIWVVHITGVEDQVELLEFMENYPASLLAYIAWDDDDRLWFYSSDDGRYFYWENTEEGWKGYSWSILESSQIYPPGALGNEGNGER